jgi:hypothetical protein
MAFLTKKAMKTYKRSRTEDPRLLMLNFPGYRDGMEQFIQGLEGVLIALHPDVQFVAFVRNDPYCFSDAIGDRLGTNVGEILGLPGDKSTLLPVKMHLPYARRYGHKENEKIGFSSPYAEGIARLKGVNVSSAYGGILILHKKRQHRRPVVKGLIIGLVPGHGFRFGRRIRKGKGLGFFPACGETGHHLGAPLLVFPLFFHALQIVPGRSGGGHDPLGRTVKVPDHKEDDQGQDQKSPDSEPYDEGKGKRKAGENPFSPAGRRHPPGGLPGSLLPGRLPGRNRLPGLGYIRALTGTGPERRRLLPDKAA